MPLQLACRLTRLQVVHNGGGAGYSMRRPTCLVDVPKGDALGKHLKVGSHGLSIDCQYVRRRRHVVLCRHRVGSGIAMATPKFDQLTQCGQTQRLAEDTVHAAVKAAHAMRVVSCGAVEKGSVPS